MELQDLKNKKIIFASKEAGAGSLLGALAKTLVPVKGSIAIASPVSFKYFENTDLSVYNTFDSIDHKLVNVYLTTCLTNENPSCVGDTKRQSYFSGKMVMLLTNTQRIDFS